VFKKDTAVILSSLHVSSIEG